MDIRKIKKLIDLLAASCIDEIEIKEGEESIRISRHNRPSHAAQAVEYVTSMPENSKTPHPPAAVEPIVDPVMTGYIVKSPMVGTFYGAASPQSPPFCKVGQTVSEGDILCIVEAMKVMNQIKSDKKGVIKSILVDAGQPVEFDQPLFVID
ncbi:MAG: acetyl-CoA carboxylase biotin carboxyl carrier protein [Endozoicomonadaceae bacterium]|nr:acetyl-CoA carboxylase biotin carboxyl carrier protein [Endozoicomonadaceae bacterium]MBE8232249.1 acetyl-CoA carboxylase biotin carboxyl carrier protein [Endozoicomonadaceae bacterium]